MSDRPCNFCSFNLLKARAERKGQVVTTKPDAGGVAVYIHGEGEEIKGLDWKVWYMELPKRCAC